MDYLRVLRARRVLILLTTAVFAAAGWALTQGEADVYEAEAALNFRGSSEDQQIFGSESVPLIDVTTRAAIGAELATQPRVVNRVRKELETDLTVDDLQARTSAQVEAQTNFVVILARSTDPDFAARLANEFARQVRDVHTATEQGRFVRAAETLRKRYARLIRESGSDNFSRNLYLERIERLNGLADFLRPVEIARVAEVPGVPVSPKPLRDAILGGILGLVLGIVAAFARDALDTRLRNPRDVESKLGLPVIGQVSSTALRSASGNGSAAVSSEEFEAFHILRANLTFLDPERVIRSVAVTSAVPEEGKTTVSLALAQAHAAAGRSTLLVECDLRRPALAPRLGLEEGPGLTEYLTGETSSEEVVRAISSGAPPSTNGEGQTARLDVITAGGPTDRPAELLSAQNFVDFLAVVSRLYDIVVLDCPPLLPVVDTLQVLPLVEGVLVCLKATSTTRDQALAAKAALERLPRRPTGLVLTGVRGGRQQAYGYYGASTAEEASAAR
jgi:capsular exopolysaccharide synthesis family protein